MSTISTATVTLTEKSHTHVTLMLLPRHQCGIDVVAGGQDG
jgi:hypothetical protein